MSHVLLPTEQAETNICWIIYQDANFKIYLSLFGWKENILPKVHIVHCTPQQFPLKVITLWNPVNEKVVPMAERWYRKIYSFCKGFKVRFLCERKLIFQFFYSFWNSPSGLDMWRGGKIHGRVENEPGGFSSSNTFFFTWELQVADTCTMILKKFLADPMIPKPKSCLFTSWYSQPYTGGSYTAIGSGGTQVLLLIFHYCPL